MGTYEGNRIICLGITHDLLQLEKMLVIMFPALKVRIIKLQMNIPTWLHPCKTISHIKAEMCRFNRYCQENYFYQAVTQVVSRWLLAADVQVQSIVVCGIYDGQGSTGTRTSPNTKLFPLPIIIQPIRCSNH
jgi:hypothetical protein